MYSTYATFPRLIALVNTQATGQGSRTNNTQQMDEMRDMMQTLVRAVHAKRLLQKGCQESFVMLWNPRLRMCL